ncbi:hypothetical protein Ssi03_30550 [Sphaerisporangium siamense]|nr:hypothetical protein Ssi03_30550 [Sphaerisporangium siamense]
MEFRRTVLFGMDPRWRVAQGAEAGAAVVSPVCSRRFGNAACQVRSARAFVAGLLGEEHPYRDDAVLLTSELAGNAVRHAAGHDFLVSVAFAAGRVLVAVEDGGSAKIPTLRRPDVEATEGRGLMLVNDIAGKWGFQRDTGGTVVWFELGEPTGSSPAEPV